MRTRWLALAGVAVAALFVAPDAARSFDVVRYEEATIADIHAARRPGNRPVHIDEDKRDDGDQQRAEQKHHERHDAAAAACPIDTSFMDLGHGSLHE